MQIYIVMAEHFSVPGLRLEPYANRDLAAIEAASLVNTMLNDTDWEQDATLENWEDRIAQLQDYHGAQYCYVEIIEKQLVGTPPPRANVDANEPTKATECQTDTLLAFTKQMAQFSTPENEFAVLTADGDAEEYRDVDEYVADMSDDRLCEEYHAFMSMVRRARAIVDADEPTKATECQTDTTSAT